MRTKDNFSIRYELVSDFNLIIKAHKKKFIYRYSKVQTADADCSSLKFLKTD